MVRLEGVLNDQNLVERIETWIANPGSRRHQARGDFFRLQGFRRREVPDAHPAAIGGLSGARPDDHRRDAECAGRARGAGEHQAGGGRRRPRSCPRRSPTACGSFPATRRASPSSFAITSWWSMRPRARRDRSRSSTRSRRRFPASRSATSSTPITHFDHAGGLRTYAAEGATIVTQAGEHSRTTSRSGPIPARSLPIVSRNRAERRCSKASSAAGRSATTRAKWSSITTPGTCTTRAC